MAAMALLFLLAKTNVSLRLQFPLHPEVKRLISMSLNLFVRSFSLNVALVLAVREATSLGTEVIAAHTIAANIWLFSAFFIDGYGAAGNVLSGRLLGAKDYKSLWVLTRRICSYNLFVCLFLMLLATLLYSFLGRLFSNETGVLQAFYSVFFIVILMQPLNALAFTLDSIFKGLGEMAYLRNTLLISTFIGFVPVLFIGRYLGWGLKGIWVAFVVWMICRAFILVIKYRSKYYRLAQI
jgi:Na+-driven multidrug efflux pump